MELSKEIEQIEKEIEEKKEIEEIEERVRNGRITIAEIGQFIKTLSDRITQKMEEMKEIDQRIVCYKDVISRLESQKAKLREEIRELNVMISEVQDMIKTVMGFVVTSKVSGKPITNSNQGKGYRVYVKTTEQGIKYGLNNVNAEFTSMAKATYALGVVSEGKRTDFKAKLQRLAEQGLIELQFL